MNREERDKLYEKLTGRLIIDTTNLDRELVEQPDLYDDAGEGYAYAVSHRDLLKNKIKDESASLQQSMRTKAAKGDKRVTEALVQAMVEGTDEIKVLRTKLIQAQREVDLWESRREAFKQRSYILRSVCDMHIAGMSASTSVKGGSVEQVRELQHQDRRKRMRATNA